jgi:hypothetical protein
MSAILRVPQNTNPLQASKFLLTFTRIGAIPFFCQSINLPGVSLGEVVRPSPFLDMYSPGTKLQYELLNISFIIDEELQGWKNLYDWFVSIADPDGFEKRRVNQEIQSKKNYSDATLSILSALNNPVMRIEFTNIFPTSMSDISFDTTTSAETILTVTATFRFQSYKYLTI